MLYAVSEQHNSFVNSAVFTIVLLQLNPPLLAELVPPVGNLVGAFLGRKPEERKDASRKGRSISVLTWGRKTSHNVHKNDIFEADSRLPQLSGAKRI